MNFAVSPSELIGSIREHLKLHAHDGIRLEPANVCALLANLRTIEELARDIEEENRILEQRLALKWTMAGDARARPHAGNVLVFRPKRQMPHVVRPDGGDAA